MKLIRRYLLRQLLAPFVFALSALTGIMLLNQIARRFGSLVGKGLPWRVIAEVFVLSVPFIVAMTLPMAVLLAVLFAFSRLAADNEVTALRASGIGVAQLLAPVLLWGAAMTMVNFAFVDQVLPKSNARLRGLLNDIGRKRPTFELREQVINEIRSSPYFLRASRVDPNSGRLRDVTIFDVSGQSDRRIIHADSGVMGFAPGGKDLSLRLFSGSIQTVRPAEPDIFLLSHFSVDEIRIRDIFDSLQRNMDALPRGDREMSTCEMVSVVDSARREAWEAGRDQRSHTLADLRRLLHLPVNPPSWQAPPAASPPPYCGWMERARTLLLPKTAEAATTAQQPPSIPRPLPEPQLPSAGAGGELTSVATVLSSRERAKEALRRADKFAVEIHKKWAISVACLPFVLIGIAMALRFPRGGMGLVIGGGLSVFSVHYVFLTAGETLADRSLVSPALAMWAPNVILTVLGAIGLLIVNREPGATRGGDLTELKDMLRAPFRRLRAGR